VTARGNQAISSAPSRGPSTEPRTQPSPAARLLPTWSSMLPTLLPTSAKRLERPGNASVQISAVFSYFVTIRNAETRSGLSCQGGRRGFESLLPLKKTRPLRGPLVGASVRRGCQLAAPRAYRGARGIVRCWSKGCHAPSILTPPLGEDIIDESSGGAPIAWSVTTTLTQAAGQMVRFVSMRFLDRAAANAFRCPMQPPLRWARGSRPSRFDEGACTRKA
jgi:hypothetical protein